MGRNIVCLRYLLSSSFVLLCISGAVVCGTGSYFLHQLRGSLTFPEWYGPPAILLTTGIINVFLGPYFWHSFDAKYNQAQLLMFLVLIVLVAIIQAGAGVWSIVSYAAVNSSLWEMLHNKLASIGTDNKPVWNATEIKVNCCGFDNSTTTDFNENTTISWSCCNTRRYNADSLEIDICVMFYVNECHHLALHRYQSILFYVFILALCAVIYQIYTIICIKTYTRASRKSMKTKRDRSVIAQQTISQRPQTECRAVNLGPQHVCEGCSNTRQ